MKISGSLACVALAVVLWSPAEAKSGHNYPMDVPASGVRTVIFEVQEGELVVRGDPAAKSVRMNVSIDRFFIFRMGEQDILKQLIKVSGQGSDTLRIVTDIPRSLGNWGRAEYPIDFEVVVPAGVNLRVRDTSGIIRISDMAGDVEVEDDSGTVAVTRVEGAVRLQKKSGDIRIEQVKGPTVIDSRTGQMRLRDLAALEVRQSDGNLFITDIESGKIHNRGGNIRVFGVKGGLEIDDESGEIEVRHVGGTVGIRDTSGQVRTYRTGALMVRDTDGDLNVEQAPALEVTAKESGEVKVREVPGAVNVPPNVKVKRTG